MTEGRKIEWWARERVAPFLADQATRGNPGKSFFYILYIFIYGFPCISETQLCPAF